MNILEALKSKRNYIRLSANSRWLVWDEKENEWVIYSDRYGRTHEAWRTADEEIAVKALFMGKGDKEQAER